MLMLLLLTATTAGAIRHAALSLAAMRRILMGPLRRALAATRTPRCVAAAFAGALLLVHPDRKPTARGRLLRLAFRGAFGRRRHVWRVSRRSGVLGRRVLAAWMAHPRRRCSSWAW